MQNATIRTAHVLYFLAFKIWLSVVFKCLRKLKNPQFLLLTIAAFAVTKNGGVLPRRLDRMARFSAHQRSSCSTLCCDWLASASAETAID
jgi:hypothetical protein